MVNLRRVSVLTSLLVVNSPHELHATTTVQANSKSGGTINCTDVADFYYGIVLALNAFPTQNNCSHAEEAAISAFLQDKLNDQLNALPGTLHTENKLCSNPINTGNRRNLVALANENDDSNHTSTTRRFLRALLADDAKYGISFIYAGGGRCRYCFYDNQDMRALLAQVSNENYASNNNKNDRDLMFLYKAMDGDTTKYPNVVDASLCPEKSSGSFFEDHFGRVNGRNTEYGKWRNKRLTPLRTKDKYRRIFHILGPYNPGERFGIHLDMRHELHNNADKEG